VLDAGLRFCVGSALGLRAGPPMGTLSPATLELLLPLLRLAPPWLVVAALAGLISAAGFFLAVGGGFRSLPTYLVLGLAAAPLCHLAGAGLPPLPAPLMIGEVDLVVVAAGTWTFLLIARLLRL
jgi:hypothetical protein